MIVVIDNYDSFTYNLVHYFEKLDPEVHVFQNDQISGEEIRKLDPHLIVLSPGPGKPLKTGASWEVLSKLSSQIPILGVCLGFQTIIEFFGGQVSKAYRPMHGKVSHITHNNYELFKGIPNPAKVTRYHSLSAEEFNLPSCLTITARAEDETIMGIAHQFLPIAGIQFHPESITTTEGFTMLKNYYEHVSLWKARNVGGKVDEESFSAF